MDPVLSIIPSRGGPRSYAGAEGGGSVEQAASNSVSSPELPISHLLPDRIAFDWIGAGMTAYVAPSCRPNNDRRSGWRQRRRR